MEQKINMEEARRAGACEAGLRWAGGRKEVTLAEVLAYKPDWAAWAERHRLCHLTHEQVKEVARYAPEAAAQYLGARLTIRQVAELVCRVPWAAAEYLADRLSAAQVAEVVRADPFAAAMYLADRLSAEQVAEVVRAIPAEVAARYLAARLTGEQLAQCRAD